MKLVPIGDCIIGHQNINPVSSAPDDNFEYIDISSIDRESKSIVKVQTLKGSEAPSRARQLVKMNDILVSTVRPNLNSVAKVPKKLDNAIASTGYCILRANEDVLDNAYLFKWVKSKNFIRDMIKKAIGANYPAVSDRIIKESKIPLPPLKTQKQIATVLDRADALIRTRRRSIEKLNEFIQSLFIEMFGNPVMNPMGWEVKCLKEISTHILSGSTPKGGKQVYVEKGILFFRSQNVWKNRILLDDVAYIDNETHLKMKKSSLRYKDILMTKTGRVNTENSSLGRAAIFLGQDNSANINGHVYLVRLQKSMVHEFILHILTTDEYREYIRRVCVGGIDKRQINKGHLEEFPIIFPPLDLQHKFATIVQTIETQKAIYQKSLDSLQTLFDSLMQRAFNGELEFSDAALEKLEESLAS